MIVKDASILLSSARQYSAITSRRESLRAWVGTRRPVFAAGQRSAGGALGTEVVDEAEIGGSGPPAPTRLQNQAAALRAVLSRPATIARQQQRLTAPCLNAANADDSVEEDEGLDTEARILKWVAEQLLGAKIHVVRAEPVQAESSSSEPGAAQAAQQPAGWGIEYERTDTYTESETTAFQSEGWVETDSGEQIAFSVSLEMARQYGVSTQVAIRAGDAAAVDPLVINLSGGAGQLTDARFDFDLDADGDAESVPFVTQGSGVLVFDKNGDNVANDGRELFGPTTGDGFAELATLDDDGNGWIDAADSVTSRLRVWTRDARGADHMQTQEQAGVGAIYLGKAETQFAIRDQANGELGEAVSTGVYLKENGEAGTVQQVNLTA